MPDAGITMAADQDHDGVADTTDNCPTVANPDQRNEDGDPFGDACDPCPQHFSTVSPQPDADRDMIGDACDPNPGMADKVWQFEGFNGTTVPWSGGGTWVPAGDHLQVTVVGNSATEDGYLTVPLTGRTIDKFNITATILAEQLTGSLGYHEFGISAYDTTRNKYINCELYKDNQGPILQLFDGITQLNVTRQFAWTTNVAYTLTMQRQGKTYTCTVVSPDGTQPVAPLSGDSGINPTAGDSVSIWAFGMTARFNSVRVVGQ